jgi:hypothetical protein
MEPGGDIGFIFEDKNPDVLQVAAVICPHQDDVTMKVINRPAGRQLDVQQIGARA